jgi:hypothetical protein
MSDCPRHPFYDAWTGLGSCPECHRGALGRIKELEAAIREITDKLTKECPKISPYSEATNRAVSLAFMALLDIPESGGGQNHPLEGRNESR